MLGTLRRIIPWLITSALSLSMILYSRDQQSNPLQGSVNDLVSIGAYPLATGLKLTALWSENRRLRRELMERRLEEAQVDEILRQNERLRQLLDFRVYTPLNVLAAEVIGFSSDEGVRGLLINRGYENGVSQNAAVITPDGLVGRVYRVYAGSAAVQLLSDPNLGVAAKLHSAAETGLVHASGSGDLRLDGIPVSARVQIGDSVLTSGQGGIFPPGILIGFATKIVPSMEGWLLNIDLSPAVELRKLDEVFIIRSNPY